VFAFVASGDGEVIVYDCKLHLRKCGDFGFGLVCSVLHLNGQLLKITEDRPTTTGPRPTPIQSHIHNRTIGP
jgi:hypothetical protein